MYNIRIHSLYERRLGARAHSNKPKVVKPRIAAFYQLPSPLERNSPYANARTRIIQLPVVSLFSSGTRRLSFYLSRAYTRVHKVFIKRAVARVRWC